MRLRRKRNHIKQDTEKDISEERQTVIEMSILSRMASDKYDELKLKFESLELAYESIFWHLKVSHKALYHACADLFSRNYPNQQYEDVDQMVQEYINDAEAKVEIEGLLKDAINGMKEPKLYICDVVKNTECKKTECHIYGGECYLTSNKEMRKE